MIVDTNGMAAWADGVKSVRYILRQSARPITPAIVLGEYRYDIDHYLRYRRSLLEQALKNRVGAARAKQRRERM